MHVLAFRPTFEDWQTQARRALANKWPPATVDWQETTAPQQTLDWGDGDDASANRTSKSRVPKRYLEAARLVALHSDHTKWALLYRILWRLIHGEPRLLDNPLEPDVITLTHFEKEVTKDAYRMTAFLRFREIKVTDGLWSVAWYEPHHDTLAINAKFFVNRFCNMRWSILTPRGCMHWDGVELSFSEGVDRSVFPVVDDVEPLWVTYYSNIFNPARLKIRAMQAQLLKRNWKNLPEAGVIAQLIREAPGREARMIAESDAKRARDSDFHAVQVPAGANLAMLRESAAHCRGCPLWRHATCTVFGEGSPGARLMLVGEQPGDSEDRAGKPFVGPAGQVLDRALAAAGIDRSATYVTNAVKHFKFEPRGKRRIHKTASPREIAACRPWLEAELALIKPALVVALGGTACHALMGAPIRVLQNRGKVLKGPQHFKMLVTVHPSSLLRLPQGVDSEQEFLRFVADLTQARMVAGC